MTTNATNAKKETERLASQLALQAAKQQIVDIVYEYDMRHSYRPSREPGVAVGRGRPAQMHESLRPKQFTESELCWSNAPKLAETTIGKIRGVLMDAGYLDHGCG
jgi:hypothetical protein